MHNTDKGFQIMMRCVHRALPIVGLLVGLSLPVTAGAQELSCGDCHNPNGVAVPHSDGCRDTSCTESCHAKPLAAIKHNTGPGTPLDSTDRTTICENCHNRPFEGVYHPYKINVSAGTPTAAGMIDLDLACGRCHGGGTNSTSNPPAPGVAYLTKANLGDFALNMHADKPVATFGYTIDRPNTLVVNVDATQSLCLDVCDAYDWDWGDGSPHSSGVTATHEYVEGNYTITLTVRDTGMGADSFSRAISVEAPDYPPTAGGTCSFNANTWTETLTDASTDDHAVVKVTVNWGDGSMLTTDASVPFGPFTHAYANVAPASPGYYTITQTAFDTIGQQNTRTCTVTPAYFTLGGTVKSKAGVNLGSATVTVKMGTTTRTAYTASTGPGAGTFSVGSLKPGTYTVRVVKTPHTFTVPAATITLGPSSSGTVITAIAP